MKPILSIDLKKNGGKKSFFSIDEINLWLSTEQAFNNIFFEARSRDPQTQTITDQISRLFKRLNNLLIAIRNAPDNEKTAHFESLKSNIENHYLGEQIIHSTSSEGLFLKKLTDSDVVVACYALGYFVNRPPNLNQENMKAIKGYNDAWAFSNGFKANSASKEALDILQSQWIENVDELKLNKKQIEENFTKLYEATKDDAHNKISEYEDLLRDKEAQLESFMSDSNERLKNIEDAYDKKMSLQASVDYWGNRESFHKLEAQKYTGHASKFGILGFLVIVFVVILAGNYDIANLSINSKNFKISDLPFWGISTIIIFISLFIWIERIFVRLILSNVHLATDAGERVVMAKTYVAMLREGQAPKDDDRKLILASLFRPNVTGIINDDAMPFNLEAMQKIIGGNKG